MGLNNLHKKLFYSDILSQKIFEKYPEWGRTREVMHLGIPDYFYYEKVKRWLRFMIECISYRPAC